MSNNLMKKITCCRISNVIICLLIFYDLLFSITAFYLKCAFVGTKKSEKEAAVLLELHEYTSTSKTSLWWTYLGH